MADEILNISIKVNDIIKSDRAKRAAISTVLAIHKRRIFQEGLDANDGRIGTYSTTPTRISPKKQARNTGKSFFEGGYDEYKSAIGKNPGFVNLINFGHMEADYGIIQNGSEFGLGFQNTENYNKSLYNQEHFDKSIFAHSQSEIDLLGNVLMFEFNRL